MSSIQDRMDPRAEVPPAGEDPEPAPARKEHDFEATNAGHLFEAQISLHPDEMYTKAPDDKEHRRIVLSMLARAWERNARLKLDEVIAEAASSVGATAGTGVDDLALLVGLGRMGKPDPDSEPF